MPSIYDNITTAEDLVFEVMQNGLSTQQDDITRAQHILAHCSDNELAYLARGGALDEDRNPPCPKNCRAQLTFFRIIFTCWDWDRAVALYNLHVTQYPKKLKEARAKADNLANMLVEARSELEQTQGDLFHAHQTELEMAASYDTATAELAGTQAALDAAQQRIIELKAELYDMIVSFAG